MLMLFGWTKETKEVGQALDCYCYRCQRTRPWEHWKETEWVSFFLVKTIPFMSKNYVVCGACREPIALDRQKVKLIGAATGSSQLADFLDERQLEGKTPVQRGYLLSQRQQRESSRQ